MSGAAFDPARAQRYWRFAPSGAGKHDTSDLLGADERALLDEWTDAFRKRFSNYLEEDCFLSVMAGDFRGKRVLSVGSGLGLHEIYYAAQGALMTCCDIVESNLKVIDRVSRRLGLEVATFAIGPDGEIKGRYDSIFIYGSLMTMPEDRQVALLDACAAALNPGGSLILMLYTWDFARDACGWTSPEHFDPAAFARATDPSVGDEHCPWSDWHDDDKLLRLAPQGFHIRRRQFWQKGWFVWYELSRDRAPVTKFFDPETFAGIPVFETDVADLEQAHADLTFEQGSLCVITAENCAGYAALSPPVEMHGSNAIIIEAEIRYGAFSAGLYDVATEKFFTANALSQRGVHTHVISVAGAPSPARLIFSNFRESPARSEFVIRRIIWVRRASASDAFVDRLQAACLSTGAPASIVSSNLDLTEDGIPLAEIFHPQALEGELLQLDADAAARALDPQMAEIAANATALTLRFYGEADLSPLGVHSPGLRDWDWRPYVDLSRLRIVKSLQALATHAPGPIRVLDVGSYFGNFSLALRLAGHDVEVVDDYEAGLGDAFGPFIANMQAHGIKVRRFADVGFDLAALPADAFDAVLFMGAIEHVPHTPRQTLVSLDRVLKSGGVLVLDTPNAGYVYNRVKVASGRSAHAPIEQQFFAEPPFGGHHREYTCEEIVWMLRWLRHEPLEVDTFGYSAFGLKQLSGTDLFYWRLMEKHPSLRELIFSVSRKRAR
ncbi:MAG: class I SAM-dependent methyltransferase [Parvularculaceae bacterium]